jgi:pimeloyl-ACP methyl ester carboxylesterase
VRRLVLAIGLFICGAAPATAGAALDFEPCAQPPGVQCAQIQVPIDRSGHVGGTFTLLVHRIPAPHPAGRPPLVFFSGGPGQTNTDLTTAAVERYGPALDDRDLIVFAQRGTGPTAIHCDALESGGDPASSVPACAAQLGAARNFYTSREAADDLETIRQQLGVDKLALVGGSYGTWVEQGYAIRHPQHVERLVLDSTFGPNQNADPFSAEQFAQAPALARALCARGRCKGISSHIYADALKLFAKLDKKPVKAHVVGPSGKRTEVTIGFLSVAALIPELDVDPHMRAELPRSIVGALKGDPGPLARLVAGGPTGPPPDPRGAGNDTLFFATRCEEDVQPFDRTAAPADRLTQARSRIALLPASAFAPYGPDLAFLLSNVPVCAYWPMLATQPSFGPGPPADVPVLIMHGEFDLRSTLKSTQTVAKEFPHAKVLTIPNEGHTPTRTPTGGCARRAAVAFLTKGTIVPCKRKSDPFGPRALVPRSLGKVKPRGIGLRGRSGRAVTAAQLTVADAFAQLDAGSLVRVAAEPKVKGGGLRAGTFRGSKKGLVLKRYEFVKGFPVTGTVRRRGDVVLKIPHGKLRFTAGGEVIGQLPRLKFSATAKLQRRSVAERL